MRTKSAIVCALMPEFDRDSGSRRVLDLVDVLRESGWRVAFVSWHANCGRRYVEVLQQRGVAVYLGAKEQLPSLVATGLFDLALFGLWHIAEPFLEEIRRNSPGTRIIVDSVDLHFLRSARKFFTERNGTGTSLNETYGSELVREINTYDAADAVLTVSGKEADLVNDFLGKKSAFAVPDCESLAASPIPPETRRGIVLVGCFRHAPNADAVAYLCREILPLVEEPVLASHPVQIVGDGLTPEIRQHGNHLPFVRMVGWVPSVVPYLEHARLTILPLRYGAGTKRKLLQTLAVGTPAVSTTIGAEGFELIDQTHVLIADQPAAFAASIARLVKDVRLWRRLAKNGRSHIAAGHSRDTVGRLLMQVVDMVMAAPPRASSPLQQKPDSGAEYAHLVARVQDILNRCVPAGATVAIANKGDTALLDLDGRTAWHFPRAESGDYAGWYPADDDGAIQTVREVAARGARYLVFPATSAWWLTHYPGLRSYLESSGTQIVNDADTCIVYTLANVGEQALARGVDRIDEAVKSGIEIALVEGPVPDEQPATVSADPADAALRVIAFLLPQFHPIPENDAWWGPGFTEWVNVMRARPLFPGHYQPRMPADLGFYDLRLADTREKQAEVARSHGIHGFCYYHYWFAGKRLLERPFDEVVASRRPDFPFCLCWANEPWSRQWNGQPQDVLQAQTYDLEDDRRHIEWLLPALADSRAITVEGKPVFIVYQAKELPDPRRTTDIWRSEVERHGLKGLYLIAVETGWDAGWDATAVGFDAKLLFQPQFSLLRTVPRSKASVAGGLEVFDYDEAWPILARPKAVGYRRYSTVFPSWDNSPRRGMAGVAIHNATPAAYEAWLRYTIANTRSEPPEHRIVFINAWNEWAEGCHLEPDVKHGRGFLEATARACRVSQAVEAVQRAEVQPLQTIGRATTARFARKTRGNGKVGSGRAIIVRAADAKPATGARGLRK